MSCVSQKLHASCWLLLLQFLDVRMNYFFELEAQHCDPKICLVPSFQDPELHHLMIIGVKAVPDLQIHKNIVELSRTHRLRLPPPVEKHNLNDGLNGQYKRKAISLLQLL